MTKRQRKRFDNWWNYFRGGVPLDEGFEVSVVKRHCEMAFLAGIKFSKEPTK